MAKVVTLQRQQQNSQNHIPTNRLLLPHQWVKWVEKWDVNDNESWWGRFCALQWHKLWVVWCTDLHRVPDSESTSALVSHIWPSSAHTRCCSFSHQSHKPTKESQKVECCAIYAPAVHRLMEYLLCVLVWHLIFEMWKLIFAVVWFKKTYVLYKVKVLSTGMSNTFRDSWLHFKEFLFIIYFNVHRYEIYLHFKDTTQSKFQRHKEKSTGSVKTFHGFCRCYCFFPFSLFFFSSWRFSLCFQWE